MNVLGRAVAVVALVSATVTTGCPLTASDDYAVGAGGASSGGGAEGQGAGTSDGGNGTGNGGSGGASGGQGGQVGTGGAAPTGALVSDGLVARWFIDEAASGQAPGKLRDGAPNALDLDLAYVNEMSFIEVGGHRGLSWTLPGLDGGARAPVDGTKVHAAVDGATELTVEMVAAVANIIDTGTRFVSVGVGIEWEPFAVLARTNSGIDFRMNGTDRSARWSVDLTDGVRHVYHFVVDTTAGSGADRIVAYIDGSPANRVDGQSPAEGEAFNLGGGRALLLGNREAGQRSVDGTLFYVAIYDRPLAASEVETNAVALEALDDTPN